MLIQNSGDTIDCPQDPLIIGFAGQSNNANRIERKELQSLNDSYMYDYISDSCVKYSEPLIGTDGVNRGHLATDFIKNLRQMGVKRPILVVGFAKGGSPVVQWSDGAYSKRTELVANSLRSKGMTMDFLLVIIHSIYPSKLILSATLLANFD